MLFMLSYPIVSRTQNFVLKAQPADAAIRLASVIALATWGQRFGGFSWRKWWENAGRARKSKKMWRKTDMLIGNCQKRLKTLRDVCFKGNKNPIYIKWLKRSVCITFPFGDQANLGRL